MLKTTVSPSHARRRAALLEKDPEACFLFFGAGEVVRNHDAHYPFRQNSEFHYLTGFDEPDAALILAAGKSWLFVQKREADQEIWTGERYGVERAKSVFQMDDAFTMDELYAKLDEILKGSSKLYYTLGVKRKNDMAVLDAIERNQRSRGKGSLAKLPIHDASFLVGQLRLVKDAEEIQLMRKTCSATAKAHLGLLRRVKPGMTEFEVANEFRYSVLKNGCTDLGYNTIAAAGFNATTLHYVRNNDLLKHGDLLLVDAGGEIENYTADITQTFPISGTFSPPQKQVYQKVLEINREITRIAKPGVSYRYLHTRATEMMVDALLSLGVLSGTPAENLKSNAYRKYFPHGLGHYLGLDVHDAGAYSENGQDFMLEPGMMLTNEPGLYFRERGNPYYGIGIRIEDDLLITKDGAEVLTHELPRDVEAIENLRIQATS